jgi:hypothetical protein
MIEIELPQKANPACRDLDLRQAALVNMGWYFAGLKSGENEKPA